jgi:CopG family transcriptional regulator, nickel-responsive regulator
VSDLVRFGVAMDRALLADFDRRIAKQGYENRSEALRDLVRSDLLRSAWDAGAQVVASLTVVYDETVREDVRQAAAQTPPEQVLATTYVRLDGARCLEVTMVRGAAGELEALSGRIGGLKGVLSCELAVAATLDGGAGSGEAPRKRR